jgi:hypothetical protein
MALWDSFPCGILPFPTCFPQYKGKNPTKPRRATDFVGHLVEFFPCIVESRFPRYNTTARIHLVDSFPCNCGKHVAADTVSIAAVYRTEVFASNNRLFSYLCLS